ncbi:hypothetical protein ACVI1L_004744 [Bradyrhizobium sp. USDA 4516]
MEFIVQREPDRGPKIDELAPFGLAVTVTMPGMVEVYSQAQARITQPARIRAGAR